MADILVIDDMRGVRRAVCAVLRGAGHSVVEAEDGVQGLEVARAKRFDLVITDIMMPGLDGTEVVIGLRELPHRPKILAISGGGAQVTPENALLVARSKADAALAKPFENDELLGTVKTLVQEH